MAATTVGAAKAVEQPANPNPVIGVTPTLMDHPLRLATLIGSLGALPIRVKTLTVALGPMSKHKQNRTPCWKWHC